MAKEFSSADLSCLFNPKSIAVFGASGRPDRPGYDTVDQATVLGWEGRVIPVTPKYGEVCGWPCAGSMAEIGEPVDLAIFAGSPARLENDLEGALDAGFRSVLIYGNPDATGDDALLKRISAMAADADVPLLGPNSIGYVNYSETSVASWVPPGVRTGGHIAAIIQSGSLFGTATLVDPRIRYSLVVHPGQECGVDTGSIMEYAMDLPETRVIALYLEIVRNPAAFIRALGKASQRGIPVVVLKPGRSEASQLAVKTHTGRMATGDHLVEAVFRRFNVLRTENTDEWLATQYLASGIPLPGPGGLTVIGDSGGMKALILDEAARRGVPLTQFEPATVDRLAGILSPELEPENPVDYWGGEEHLVDHIDNCLQTAARDPGTAIVVGFGEFGVESQDVFTDNVSAGIKRGAAASPVPVVAASYSSRQFNPDRIMDLDRDGIPVIDGITNAIGAVAKLFRFRDRIPWQPAQDPTGEEVSRLGGLADGLLDCDELAALELLERTGITIAPSWRIRSRQELESLIPDLDRDRRWPVALKTASGLLHKSEHRGVVTGIAGPEELERQYREMSARLGQNALVQCMAGPGQEIALGMINDPEFGPFIMLSTGGVDVEQAGDRMFAWCPVSDSDIERLIDNLACRHRMDGYRGAPPLDMDSLRHAVRCLDRLAMANPDALAAVDINPVILHAGGAVAVDAVIETKQPPPK